MLMTQEHTGGEEGMAVARRERKCGVERKVLDARKGKLQVPKDN